MAAEVNAVIPGLLFQGGYLAPAYLRPPAYLHVACAYERSPSANSADVVVHFPLDDDPDTAWADSPEWCAQVDEMAQLCADTVRHGLPLLVTCNMGWNRSGLITGLTLCFLGYPASRAITMVRRARGKNALSNPQFVRVIEELDLRQALRNPRRRVKAREPRRPRPARGRGALRARGR